MTSARRTSISRFFEQLDAPLKNVRWSWGAERPRDGAVFLRVWDDETRSEGGQRIVQVLGDWGTDRPGYKERLRQLDRVRAGRDCYLVFCHTDEPDEKPRTIKSFDGQNVYRGGRLTER